MHYHLVFFGVKDTSRDILEYLTGLQKKPDLLVTIADEAVKRNDISGYESLGETAERLGIEVYSAADYALKDDETTAFFTSGENTFDLGIVVGWQRLIPGAVLQAFSKGIFGFHGNCGYLPFGRGRSPLNWSILLGDRRFNLNLFRYDEAADSPNVFATEMFQINEHDSIRTAQYKQLLCTRKLLTMLLTAEENGEIPIRIDSKDTDSWYEKRTPADGKINWQDRTRHIYDLIRAVTKPFPGAFCETEDGMRVTVWEAHPFDEIMDFHAFAPGEVIAVFAEKPVVRTVDGSLLIDSYESDAPLREGQTLR